MGREIELWPLKRFGSAPLRLDWFGHVTRSSRTGNVVPYVTVSCSQLGTIGLKAEAAAGKQMLSVDVPIQWLRLLRLGDVWEAGRRVGSVELDRVTFQGLRIDDAAAQVVPCGLSALGQDGGRRHELPFGLFKKHVDHTMAYMVRVEVQPGMVLLIPSMEAIRFYFGSSGALLQNIFSGFFAKERLYQSANRNSTTGVANIQLAKGVPAMAASTVARIAFDTIARRQFKSIVNTGVKAAAAREPWYPRSGFPFVGDTDLTVEGVWIDHPPERVFVAHRIISCTHPFPFSKLFYKTDIETISKLVSASRNGEKEGAERPRSQDVAIRQGAQDSTLAPAVVPGAQDEVLVAFPDLISKQIARVKSDLTPGGRATPKASNSGEQPVDLAMGFNRAGASRPADVSDNLEPQDSGFAEPDVLRNLRGAAAAQLPDIMRPMSPLGRHQPSSRLEVETDDRDTAGIWVSRFNVTEGGVAVRSILVMHLEGQTSADAPELLMFDLYENLTTNEALLSKMARIYWTADEERDALAKRHSLVHSWSSKALAGTDASTLMLTLLDHSMNPDFDAEDDSSASGEREEQHVAV